MHYLNDLGANVRNHMSTIEDKFVDQARHDFPGEQKKPKLPDAAPALGAAPKADLQPKTERPAAIKPVPSTATSGGGTIKTAPAKETPKASQHYPKRETTGTARAPRPNSNPNPNPSANNRPQQSTTDDKAGGRRETGQRSTSGGSGARQERKPWPGKKPGGTNPTPANRPSPGGDNRPATTSNRTGQGHFSANSGRKSGPGEAGRGDSRRNRPAIATDTSKGKSFQEKSSESRFNGRRNSRSNVSRVAPKKPQGPMTNVKSVELPVSMTVKDFSQLLEIAAGEVIKKLMGLGLMATINQEIDYDTMALIAEEFKVTATPAQTEEEKLQVEEVEDDPASLEQRPPVVTIMGHVDHGKTSLLDAIRQTDVTAHEAGGITQHIGAYQVELNERKITFLDTPGHEAFTAMRARGAQATDIAILVVAADDGVMPQTVEALNHAKDANVPIIVAINKVDKPGANSERIKQELTEYGLVAEEWGGDTIFVPVSAKEKTGIENLLEMILLVADLKDYKANPNRLAKGIIIEAQLDKGQGPVATVLVQNGTLTMSDSIIAGSAAGKVKALINDKGKRLKKAGPSTPVKVIGFDELPEAGDILYAISEERLARQLADRRTQFKRESELQHNQKVTLNDLFSKIKEGALKEVKIIIKADVQGSVEAIRQSLEKLSNDEVKVKVIHGGVGAIGEGDVMLASASSAIIVGFNVRPDPIGKRLAEKENVDLRLYRIIYNIIDDVKNAMEGMLEPEFKEVIAGKAEIRLVYKVPKVGNIGGCQVLEGKITRNNDVRLIRDNIVIHEGKISSLKRFKDDVREVLAGFECGIGIERFNDLKEGDIIEAFVMEEIKRTH